jgi:hypothetical protein
MRTLLLVFGLVALSVSAQAQVKDSLVIRFKSGDSVKIPFKKIESLRFRTLVSKVEDNVPSISPTSVFPNPSSVGATITFTLSKPQMVVINLIDMNGHSVRTFSSRREAGAQEMKWDGLLDNGESAASGSYIYRILTSDEIMSGKLTLRR